MKPNRIIIAAVIVPLLISYIHFLPPFPYFLALLAVVSMIAMHEFYVMYKVPRRFRVPMIFTGGVLFYALCRYPEHVSDIIFFSVFLVLGFRLIAEKTPSGSMMVIGPLITGFLYISCFLSFQWFVRTGVLGKEYIFLLFASVWMADSMAYYIGSYAGRKKLYYAISPNKTVEGALGSVAGGSIGAFAVQSFFSIAGLTAIGSLCIGAVLGAVTVIGDLMESMFKRDAGIKDSSGLIPGHGGLLDKIDGLLVAGPVLYFIVRSL